MGDYFHVNWALDLPYVVGEHINVKEFLCMFLAVCRWGSFWKDKRVIIYSDNSSAVAWLNKGTSRNPSAMAVCRLLFWVTASLDCSLTAKFLPGKNNIIADAASRLHELGKFNELYQIEPPLQYETFHVENLFRHMSPLFIFFQIWRAF